MKTCLILSIFVFMFYRSMSAAILADHECTKIEKIPIAAVEAAKSTLHIAYGLTSHGSQITEGMTGLVNFMNSKGYPIDLFAWNFTGSNGALHLYEGDGYGDGDLDHDAGYYPEWVNETRDYLGQPTADGRGSNHPDMNVIMWSWCGQLSWYSASEVQTKYLDEMSALERDYPGITFVYMTGHSDGSGLEGVLHANNQKIRNYCLANDKVLFDFYDIECYDPDGNYFGDKFVSDDCSYDGGNWALEWQNAHLAGVDWYDCGSAHSQPLNANQKAYAIWWLWARLAGWDGESNETAIRKDHVDFRQSVLLYQNAPNPFNHSTVIRFRLSRETLTSLSIYRLDGTLFMQMPEEYKSPGEHAVKIEFQNASSGIYYFRLQAGTYAETRRLVLLR